MTVEDGTGARRQIHRTVTSGGSFGASPLAQHIGLGKSARIVEVEVRWPTSGTRQAFVDVAKNQVIEIREMANQLYAAQPPETAASEGVVAGRPAALLVFVLLSMFVGRSLGAADREYAVTGMVISVDPAGKWFGVSHERIADFMDAMTMPFEVRQREDLQGVVPGAIVEFTLVVGEKTAYATRIVVRHYQTVEQDPRTASRLSVMKRMAGFSTTPVALGARVPDFALVDQARRRVTLSSFVGKVVVVNFVYTRCALPQFCLRMANDFGALQKRFPRDLRTGSGAAHHHIRSRA